MAVVVTKLALTGGKVESKRSTEDSRRQEETEWQRAGSRIQIAEGRRAKKETMTL